MTTAKAPNGHVPLILTVIGAAEHLGVSESTMHRLLKSGAIPSVKIGKTRWVRTRDLEEYVNRLEPVGTD